MFTVFERDTDGPRLRQQFETFEAALFEVARFVRLPGSWQAYITNADSVIVAELKGKAAVPECQSLACPPAVAPLARLAREPFLGQEKPFAPVSYGLAPSA